MITAEKLVETFRKYNIVPTAYVIFRACERRTEGEAPRFCGCAATAIALAAGLVTVDELFDMAGVNASILLYGRLSAVYNALDQDVIFESWDCGRKIDKIVGTQRQCTKKRTALNGAILGARRVLKPRSQSAIAEE